MPTGLYVVYYRLYHVFWGQSFSSQTAGEMVIMNDGSAQVCGIQVEGVPLVDYWRVDDWRA